MKGFQLHPRDAILVPKEHWLTQNIDQTWDIKLPHLQRLESLSFGSLHYAEPVIHAFSPSCHSHCSHAWVPASAAVTADPSKKEGLRPQPNYCILFSSLHWTLVRPRRPLSSRTLNVLPFRCLWSSSNSSWQYSGLHFPEPKFTFLYSFIWDLLVYLPWSLFVCLVFPHSPYPSWNFENSNKWHSFHTHICEKIDWQTCK